METRIDVDYATRRVMQESTLFTYVQFAELYPDDNPDIVDERYIRILQLLLESAPQMTRQIQEELQTFQERRRPASNFYERYHNFWELKYEFDGELQEAIERENLYFAVLRQVTVTIDLLLEGMFEGEVGSPIHDMAANISIVLEQRIFDSFVDENEGAS